MEHLLNAIAIGVIGACLLAILKYSIYEDDGK